MFIKFIYLALPLLMLSCTQYSDEVSSAPPARCQCTTTNPKAVRSSHPGLGPIVILGDGLAHGIGSSEKSMHALVPCLQGRYAEKVTLLSHTSDTSELIRARLPEVLALKPRLVVVSAGYDDVMVDRFQPGTYPPEKTLSEMNEIFDSLIKSGALVVYLGLNPPIYYSERLAKVWDLATSKGILVVDAMSGLWLDKTMMTDERYPNEAGYASICLRVNSTLKDHYP